MNGLPWVDGVFYHHFALTLLHSLWQGLLLAAFGVVACHCLAGRSATARYRVWTTTFLLMVICLPATFVWLSQDSAVHVPAATESVFISPTLNVTSDSTDAVGHSTKPTSLTGGIGPWTTWLYLLGLGFMLARTFLGLLATKRLRREASPLPESSFLESIRSYARRLGLRGMPLVAYCERVAVPSLVGLWRPMILLPPALATGLTPQQLEMVVLHELVHLSRRDNLWIVVQRVSEAILFFHPAAWYVSRRVSIERELRCDFPAEQRQAREVIRTAPRDDGPADHGGDDDEHRSKAEQKPVDVRRGVVFLEDQLQSVGKRLAEAEEEPFVHEVEFERLPDVVLAEGEVGPVGPDTVLRPGGDLTLEEDQVRTRPQDHVDDHSNDDHADEELCW